MTKSSNQSGFAAVEAVLIIVILAIIGFTGWYVWHSSQKTNSTLASSNQQSQAPQPVKYLAIKEWGVRFPYQDTNTYSYKMAPDNGSVEVISSVLAKKYDCTTNGAGLIYRLQPTDAHVGTNQAVAAAAKQHPGVYGHAGNYYYAFTPEQSACSTKVPAAAQTQANDFVKTLISKVQAVPAAPKAKS